MEICIERRRNAMNKDMKLGYNIGCNRLNNEIEAMIDEIHDMYMQSEDMDDKFRLDAQMSILWTFKAKIENAIAEGE